MVGARRREDEVLALGDGAGVHPKYDGKQRQELPLGHLTCGRTSAEVCRALKGMEPGAGGFSPTEFGWHKMGKAYTGRKGARRCVVVVWSFHPWCLAQRGRFPGFNVGGLWDFCNEEHPHRSPRRLGTSGRNVNAFIGQEST